MNAATRLKKYMDAYFGFKNENPKLKSTIRKISETFDEEASVRVITLEYRVKQYAGGRIIKKIKENSLLHSLLK